MLKEKFRNHCERPVTWGKYYKLCGIVIAVYAVVIGIVALGYKFRQYAIRLTEMFGFEGD